MGRALTRVISETPAPSSPARWKRRVPNCWARMPARWRACPPTASLSADLWSLSANADGILDFTVPGATIANVAIAASGPWSTSSAPPVCRPR
jgi:4-hydroxy-tetrahydrodipicolinate reductase